MTLLLDDDSGDVYDNGVVATPWLVQGIVTRMLRRKAHLESSEFWFCAGPEFNRRTWPTKDTQVRLLDLH